VIDGQETAAAARDIVVDFGGAFMTSPEAKAAGKEHGYRGWQLYMTGRAGVLGDVPVEVVEAAVGFFDPGLVRFGWEGGRAVAPLPVTVERYVGVCRAWGRHRLGELAEADRLADLFGAVISAADAAGWPLFAAWRVQPLPDDPPGRVAQLLQVLREHRGGAHLGAVRACGLRPLEAVVAGEGTEEARFFGWRGDLPVPDDDMRARRARAEEATNAQVAPAYAVLDETERAELLRMLGELAAVARRAA
jgi:hypothetical protein